MLEETLARGAREGIFRDDMDAVNVYISIAGISFFYFSNNPTLSAIFGRNLRSEQTIAQRRAHVIDFALSALRPTN
jgi:TetR/AcrR family transcriptional regulator